MTLQLSASYRQNRYVSERAHGARGRCAGISRRIHRSFIEVRASRQRGSRAVPIETREKTYDIPSHFAFYFISLRRADRILAVVVVNRADFIRKAPVLWSRRPWEENAMSGRSVDYMSDGTGTGAAHSHLDHGLRSFCCTFQIRGSTTRDILRTIYCEHQKSTNRQ